MKNIKNLIIILIILIIALILSSYLGILKINLTGKAITCSSQEKKVQAIGIIYKEGGNEQLTKQWILACCHSFNYCVDVNKNCVEKLSASDADVDGDKEYCGEDGRWYEIDSYKKGYVGYPINNNIDKFDDICNKIIGPGNWNIGGDAISAKDDKTGYNFCCGDDEDEYKIDGVDGSLACCKDKDALVEKGICKAPIKMEEKEETQLPLPQQKKSFFSNLLNKILSIFHKL